jgi:hypothetical protein
MFLKYAIFQNRKMVSIRKIPSERDIVKRLESPDFAFPPLRFEATYGNSNQPDKSDWDLLTKASWDGREARFAAECKALSTPKAFQEAVQRVRDVRPPDGALPLVVLPFLRESQLRELEQLGISGVDLCGNGVVIVPGQFAVFRTGAPNQFPTYAPIKNVYRKNTSMVARALLAVPYFESVQDVLDAVAARDVLASRWTKTPMRLGTVSKALKALEEALILDRKQGVRLLQGEKLLDKLHGNYEPPRALNRVRLKVETSGASLTDVLRTESNRAGLPVVAAGLSSVWRYATMQREDMLSVYCPRCAPLVDRLPGRETARFPNLEIIETDEQPPYFDAQDDDGFLWASPVETYLELMAGDKRDRETAEQVRAYVLECVESGGQ